MYSDLTQAERCGKMAIYIYNNCCNKNIAGRTQKEWQEEHIDIVKNYQITYRDKNKEKIKRTK